jgi:hypothetical protein
VYQKEITKSTPGDNLSGNGRQRLSVRAVASRKVELTQGIQVKKTLKLSGAPCGDLFQHRFAQSPILNATGRYRGAGQ